MTGVIAFMKALHIAALVVWCAGLIALPLILSAYGRGSRITTQAGYSEFRVLSHHSYTMVITPAAVIAIGAGTALIFLEQVNDPWLMAKLGAVAGMVLLHAWMGHMISQAGDEGGSYRLPPPLLALAGGVPLMALVLWLVLAKPDLAPLLDRVPEWLRQPLGRELPPGLVPI
jgi:protoporphyrinogen IX oxidase